MENPMIDILEFIDELKELQVLYNEGELCNFDCESKIHKFQKQINDFEQSMQDELDFASNKFRSPLEA
jgi:hypothetical protein